MIGFLWRWTLRGNKGENNVQCLTPSSTQLLLEKWKKHFCSKKIILMYRRSFKWKKTFTEIKLLAKKSNTFSIGQLYLMIVLISFMLMACQLCQDVLQKCFFFNFRLPAYKSYLVIYIFWLANKILYISNYVFHWKS